MSPKLFVLFLALGILALTAQAGAGSLKGPSLESLELKSDECELEEPIEPPKSDECEPEEPTEPPKSDECESEESKEPPKSDECESEEEPKSEEDCEEPPKPTLPPKKCPPNEIWNDCGTACPLTCAKPKPRPCIKKCVAGCECLPGLLRNKWGKCVEPCDC